MVSRCRLYVAAAGYGKTTVRESMDGPVAYRVAAQVLAAPQTLVGERAAHVVVDDLGMLDDEALARLARTLNRVPADVPLALASRRPLDRAALSTLDRTVTERTAVDLGMRADAVAVVLADEYGVADGELAHLVAELTAGWPAL